MARSPDRCRYLVWGLVVFGGPELPPHLELVGHVVVELLGGFGDGVFDDGVFEVSWARSSLT